MSGNSTVRPGIPASISIPVNRVGTGTLKSAEDLVSVEEPMAIQLVKADQSEHDFSITMRTPGQDFELALGYLFGEGVISTVDDVVGIDYADDASLDKGLQNVVQVQLAANVNFDFSRLARNSYASASCGVCGKTSIDSIHVPHAASEKVQFDLSNCLLSALPQKLRHYQSEFERTGGIHAAATINQQGDIERLREDIGRHNAVDKLIGSYFDASFAPLRSLGLLLSGRAGFELIQKAAVADMPFVASIGPPSSLAVELAETHNIQLIGFLRESSHNQYTSLDQSESV